MKIQRRYRIGDISPSGKITFDGGAPRRFLYGKAYAGQSFFGTPNGKTIYLSWLRMSPSPERQWTGCLSTPMELQLKNGELFVKPFDSSLGFKNDCLCNYLDFTPDGAAGCGRVLTDTFTTEYFDDSERFAVVNDKQLQRKN